MKPRRRARVVALQTLYETDVARHDPADALKNRLVDSPLDGEALEFAERLINGVVQQRETLDQLIPQVAPEWPLAQIAAVDRTILRLGIYEILFEPDVPLKVAINEAIELAKMFGSDSTPRFVNGALGALAEKRNEYAQQFHIERAPSAHSADAPVSSPPLKP